MVVYSCFNGVSDLSIGVRYPSYTSPIKTILHWIWRIVYLVVYILLWGFLDGSVGKESICNAGDMSLIPGSGRPPRGGNGHPLQYSCLENPMDRGAWRAIFHGVTVRYNLATKHSFSCISVM